MRISKRTYVALAATGALGGVTAAALATAPSGDVVTPLARGKLVTPVKINDKVGNGTVKVQAKGPLDAATIQHTLAPGGTGGWHRLAGPHITIVTQGTLTIIDAKCKRHDLPAGRANFVSGTPLDKSENLGSTPVVWYVTFLIPHGVQRPRIDQPAPAGCTA